MPSFLERYRDNIAGVISCFDCVIIQGILPNACHPKALTDWFYARKIWIFDYKLWTAPMHDQIRDNIEKVAAEAGVEIEFVRKEQRVKGITVRRGDHPGVVCFIGKEFGPPLGLGEGRRGCGMVLHGFHKSLLIRGLWFRYAKTG